MTMKSLAKNIGIWTLTFGAGLITGLLSLSGMLALVPSVPLAITSFILAVAYEGEIFKENIQSALQKLSQKTFLEEEIAKNILAKIFPLNDNPDLPEFFYDYELKLQESHDLCHEKATEETKIKQKAVQESLDRMERFFTQQLFYPKKTSAYQQSLNKWIEETQSAEDASVRLKSKQAWILGTQIFTVIASLFMLIGTSYLLMEAFAAIPILAAIPAAFLPILIVPMSILATVAYGLITYNSTVDFINHDSLNQWIKKIGHFFSPEGFSVKNLFLGIGAIGFTLMMVFLTICTAGTWWTIASKSKPLFQWMQHIPVFIMGLINPIISGIAQLIFNLENTFTTLNLFESWSKTETSFSDFFVQKYTAVHDYFEQLAMDENIGQLLNPFRIILFLAITPLRMLLFIGHACSMALTSDRVPGLSEAAAFGAGVAAEIVVDLPYFVDDENANNDPSHRKAENLVQERLAGKGHSHDHSNDLPTQIIYFLFSPLYLLATLWDHAFSQFNREAAKKRSFHQAWLIQTGQGLPEAQEEKERLPEAQEEERLPEAPKKACVYCKPKPKPNLANFPIKNFEDLKKAEFCFVLTENKENLINDNQFDNWQREELCLVIEEKEEHLINNAWFDRDLAANKAAYLGDLRSEIMKRKKDAPKTILQEHLNNPEIYALTNRHRFFASNHPSDTHNLLQHELERLELVMAF